MFANLRLYLFDKNFIFLTSQSFCRFRLNNLLIFRIAEPKPESYHIYLGKYHRNKEYFDKGQIEAKISQIVVHPDYNSETNDNDIALITVRSLLQISSLTI